MANNIIESESNNDRTTANLLSLGETVSGIMGAAQGDIDYYAFTSGPSGAVSISLESPDTLPDEAFIYLYDANGYLFAFSRGMNFSAKFNIGTPPGSYYLAISQPFIRTNSTQYDLTVSDAIGVNESEKNDSVATSDSISLGVAIYGQTSPYSDDDYYLVSIATAGAWTIKFDDPDNSNLQIIDHTITVLDTAGNTILRDQTGYDRSLVLNTSAPGSYYIKINAGQPWDYLNTKQYSLVVTQGAETGHSPETEINDSRTTADPISLGTIVHGQLASPTDTDFYAVSLSSPGVLQIAFDAPPASQGGLPYFSVSVFDQSGTLLASRTSGDDLVFDVAVVLSGTYYFSVERGADTPNVSGQFNSGQYSLSISSVPGNLSDYESEANNSLVSADPIASGQEIQGQLSSATDTDYFSIAVGSSGILNIGFDDPIAIGYFGDFHLSVYDTAGNVIWAKTTDADFAATLGVHTPGIYYVSIGKGDDSFTASRSGSPYHLTVTATAEDASAYENEANNSGLTANPLAMGNVVLGQLLSPADTDYFRVATDTASVLSITFDAPSDHSFIASWLISVYDSSGVLLGAQTAEDDIALDIGAEAPGDYYISVSTPGQSQYGHDAGQYSISVNKSSADIAAYESESNDSLLTPDHLAVNATINGRLSTYTDVDIYSVSVLEPGLYDIVLSSSDERSQYGSFKLVFWDPKYFTIGSWNTGYTYETPHMWLETPGTYYFWVSGEGTQYSLSLAESSFVWTDDFGGTVDTAGQITLDNAVAGTVTVGGDRDWFEVALKAGQAYEITLTGKYLPSNYLAPELAIRDESGEIIWGSFVGGVKINGESFERESYTTFVPTADGTYYLSATGYQGSTGDYSILIKEVAGDLRASAETTGTMPIGGTTNGSVDFSRDTDWYQVELQAGVTYDFKVTGFYDHILKLRSPTGEILESVGEVSYNWPTYLDWPFSTDPEIAFTAPVSDTFFIDVAARHLINPYTSYEVETAIQPQQASIDALLMGLRWNAGSATGTPITVSYSFPTSEPVEYWDGTLGFHTFTAAQKDVVREILQQYSQFTNVTFQEVSTGAGLKGQIRFAWEPFGDSSITAITLPYGDEDQYTRADIFLNTDVFSAAATPVVGGELYFDLLHEIGHSLGLKHPGNYDLYGSDLPPYLPFALDNNTFSLMSYEEKLDANIFNTQPALLDVLALQNLYGTNNGSHIGNDVYAYPSGTEHLSTIWDGGGTDTIDASGQTSATMIFLEPGTLSSIGTTKTGEAAHDNVAIAFGAQIEKATGGGGNDLIIGNALDNTLTGGDGTDTLIGGSGKDALDGGSGSDVAQYSGTRSDYSLSLAGGTYTVTDINSSDGDDGSDTLTNIEQLAFADVTMNLGSNHSPTGNVGIDGSATQGQTLSAANTLIDFDGLGTLNYQWQSGSGSTWNIIGTGTTLLLTQAQVGQHIRVMASYTDGFGTLESITSAATAAVANINDAPLITSAASASIAENVAPGTVVYTLTASDPDAGQNVSFSLGGADAAAFDFDASSGQISLKTSPNFEAKSSYSLSVTASDDVAQPLSATQTVTIGVTDVATSRYTTLGSSNSFLDFYSYGNLSLDGQEIVFKGNAGTDAVYVDGADNLLFDFTQAGLGIDKIYLEGHWADYAAGFSGSVVTLTRTSGGSEAVKAISGDGLIFADGTLAVAEVLSFLKGTGPDPVPSGEMSTAFPQAVPDGLSNTLRAVVQDAGGEFLAMARPGEDLVVKGGSGSDMVCVAPGSHVDATQLGLGQDKIYLAGHLSDYSGSVAGNAVTLSRDVAGHSESVKLLGGSSNAFDSIVFLDGMAKSVEVLDYFKGGALPALALEEVSPLLPWASNVSSLDLNGAELTLTGGYSGTGDLVASGGSSSYAVSSDGTSSNSMTGISLTSDTSISISGGSLSLAGSGSATSAGNSSTVSNGTLFVLSPDTGGNTVADADQIVDFTDGQDLIGLSGGLTFSDLTIAQGSGTDTAASNTVISNAGEYLAVLLNISATSITLSDFQALGV